jgi:ribosomal protein L30
VLGTTAGAKVMLKPASAGTGVIAAGGVRAVLEAAGVRDILTKSMGSANVLNVVKATFDALDQLKSPEEEAIGAENPPRICCPSGSGGRMPEKKLKKEKNAADYFGKSAIGYSERHKATVRALGLRRLNQSVVQEDTPTLRGMLSQR